MSHFFSLTARQYGVAVMSAATAFLLTKILEPVISPTVFMLFYPAALVSALYGGIVPAIVTCILSVLACQYAFIEPVNSFAIADSIAAFRLFGFAVTSLLVSCISAALRTARQRLESNLHKLQLSEERLWSANQQITEILESTTDGFIALDQNWQFTYLNRRAEQFFGRERSELMGQRIWDVFPRAANSETYQQFYRAISEKTAVAYETNTIDATDRWFEVHAYPVTKGLAAYFQEISDRKQAEIDLQNSEQRFRQLAENIHEVFWMSDPRNSQMLYVSPAYETIWGRSCQSLYDSPISWIESVHPDDREQVLAAATRLRSGERNFDEEYRIVRPNGEIRWIRARTSYIRDELNEIYRVVGIAEDISNRKCIEAALRKTEQRFRIAQELSLDAFTILQSIRDETGKITDFEINYVNPKAAEIINYSIHELIGKRLLDVLPDTKASGLFDRYVEVAETGKPHDIEVYYDQDKIQEWFRNMTIKVDDGIAVSFYSISDRKQAEAEREQLLAREQAARQEAETANQVKDQFLAVLSHELRSPLNPILGWASLLRSRKFDALATDRALATIERNAKLQAQLIDDLLDVSRILRGKMTLDMQPVDLVSTIQSAIETVRLAAEAKSIQIETDYDPEVGQVLGDTGRLQQVVWNLLSNAVKFTSTEGKIHISLSREEMNAKIQVRDTGKGISADFLPYVFDYFRQADGSTTRQFGGLGLGLAIVRHITELHGGTVQVHSDGEEKGSSFVVTLPLMVVAIPAPPPATVLPSQVDLQGIQVLIVDDEADIRDVIAFILEEYGAKPIVASSAAAAWQMWEQIHPDVLISDIGMPDMDGYTLIRNIRTLPKEKGGQIPAIALTAYAGEFNQQKAIEAGFHLHISKPVEPEHLAESVAHLLDRINYA
jgi:PAS domain S-box-containing protein